MIKTIPPFKTLPKKTI